MAAGARKDPYKNNRYLLEIQGITQAGFREATAGDTTQDPIDYREGNDPTHVRKLPGLTKFGNITLKWGNTDSLDLYNWRKQVEDGKIKDARKNVAIVVMDDEGKSTSRWEISQAWPTKYTAPSFNATANEVAIETLELTHEGMKRTK
jgi:phage tail-like protein